MYSERELLGHAATCWLNGPRARALAGELSVGLLGSHARGDPAAVSDVDLRRFLRTRLAPEELPTRFLHLDALPRNAGGKVDKRALIERFAA